MVNSQKKFLCATSALTVVLLGALALSGCQQSESATPWAKITVNNSNGQQAAITCQQRADCPELVQALAGQYRPTFLYPLRAKDRVDGRYQQYQLGQRVVPGRPELLPRLLLTNRDKPAGPCLIIRWGPERLRVSGQIAGRAVAVNVSRQDSCAEDQYLLWNIFAPTDQQLNKTTVIAQRPQQQ